MLVGIGGVSQAGKSALANKMTQALSAKGITSTILEIDTFVLPESQIPKIRDRTDWEDPASVDWQRLLDAIRSAERDVVIVEGIFVFDARLSSLLDISFQIELDEVHFFNRRRVETRWGDEPDWYLQHVWESNLKLLAGVESDLSLRYDDPDMVQKTVNFIMNHITPSKDE